MQQATRVFAIRHGRTAWNAEQRIQGQRDVPLDAIGRWQAAQVAQALGDEVLDAIYSSDLLRAQATAQPLAERTGAPLLTDARLRERGFGRFEGQTYADVHAQWPEDAARWRLREIDFQPGGGETLTGFYSRCVDAVCALAACHPGGAIAVVAHGGVLDCLYRAAVGVELTAPRSWQLGNATINRLLFNGEHLCLVGWNDAAHLEAPPPDAA